uniref:Uncharacterized protein n=1 Tax=Oryza nivara TaxID=4536 RepID=A0A0E0HQH4_ORYNI
MAFATSFPSPPFCALKLIVGRKPAEGKWLCSWLPRNSLLVETLAISEGEEAEGALPACPIARARATGCGLLLLLLLLLLELLCVEEAPSRSTSSLHGMAMPRFMEAQQATAPGS